MNSNIEWLHSSCQVYVKIENFRSDAADFEKVWYTDKANNLFNHWRRMQTFKLKDSTSDFACFSLLTTKSMHLILLATFQSAPYVSRLILCLARGHVLQVMSVQCENQLTDTWNLPQIVQGIFCSLHVTSNAAVLGGDSFDCFGAFKSFVGTFQMETYEMAITKHLLLKRVHHLFLKAPMFARWSSFRFDLFDNIR